MCEYCDKRKGLEKIQDVRKLIYGGENVFEVVFTDSAVVIFHDFDERHTPINFCPMCGRDLREKVE